MASEVPIFGRFGVNRLPILTFVALGGDFVRAEARDA